MKQHIYEEDGRIKWQIRLFLATVILIILLAESCFLYYHNPKDTKWLICIMYTLTGYYCPGCGAGRAYYSILHGQFYQAFRYNPFFVIVVPWLGSYLVICTLQWVLTGRENISRRIPVWMLYGVMAVAVVYGILRNIDVYPFTSLIPTRVR